jgi:hypothetical protein
MNEKENPFENLRKRISAYIEKDAKDRKILALEKKVDELNDKIESIITFKLPIHIKDNDEEVFIPFAVGLN